MNIILNSVSDQYNHVVGNILFSTIAVRNNHLFSESLGIFTISELFPFLTKSKERSRKFRKVFENEVMFQIQEDGSDNQYSFNYHRNKLQLITLFIALSNDIRILPSFDFLDRFKSSVYFLKYFVRPNGQVPNYGMNDGSLPFMFHSNYDYKNFIPQIETGLKVFHSRPLHYSNDFNFFFHNINLGQPTSEQAFEYGNWEGTKHFKSLGYFLCQSSNKFFFIRVGNHPFRPSQPDNHHIDLWKGNENLLCDTGNFSYNSKDKTSGFFNSSRSNNVVTINGQDQMKRLLNFTWIDWTKTNKFVFDFKDNVLELESELHAFKQIDPKLILKRQVILNFNIAELVVKDTIFNCCSDMHLELSQHFNTPFLEIENFSSENKISKHEAFRSQYYSTYTRINQLVTSTSSKHIKTTIKF